MRSKIWVAAALLGAAFALGACNGRKSGETMTEAERFKSGLTADDTTQMLKICNDCMDTLKAGRVEEALKVIYAADSVKGAVPLTPEQKQELRNTFRLFPVIDYRMVSFTFNTSGLNDVKYEIKFFEKEEGDPTPNMTAFMFNPVKHDGKWYLTVKQSNQEVLDR